MTHSQSREWVILLKIEVGVLALVTMEWVVLALVTKLRI